MRPERRCETPRKPSTRTGSRRFDRRRGADTRNRRPPPASSRRSRSRKKCRQERAAPPRPTAEHDRLGAAHVAGHDARLQENAGAYHVGDVDRDRRPRAHAPRQFGPRASLCEASRLSHQCSIGYMSRRVLANLALDVRGCWWPLLVYRRFRRNFGRQLLQPDRMTMRIVMLLVLGAALAPRHCVRRAYLRGARSAALRPASRSRYGARSARVS